MEETLKMNLLHYIRNLRTNKIITQVLMDKPEAPITATDDKLVTAALQLNYDVAALR